MDGGGRLLRSIGEVGAKLAPSSFAFAGAADPYSFPSLAPTAPRLPRPRRRGRVIRYGLQRLFGSRFFGSVLAVCFLSTTIAYGAVRGGQYDAFVADNGTVPDILARVAGFDIKAVTITGAHELSERELLDIAGIGPRTSLIFLNVDDLRARLKAMPLIKEASVSKLYPNRVLVEIEERQPYALWQKDGVVQIVAVDGTPIDDLRDLRFSRLPLVVGSDANTKLPDYNEILAAAGDLRDRVRAGLYVAGRRWTLLTDSGIEIALPETNAAESVARLAKLEHDSHILEKDIRSLDLRIAGRVVARLSDDAAAARAELVAKKTKKKGATT